MRGDEANKFPPRFILFKFMSSDDKADLNICFYSFKKGCERALIAEMYLDLTKAAEKMMKESLESIHEEVLKSHVLGLNLKLMQQKDGDHRDKLDKPIGTVVKKLQGRGYSDETFRDDLSSATSLRPSELVNGGGHGGVAYVVVEGGGRHVEEGGGRLAEVGGGRLVEVGGGRRVQLVEKGGGLHDAVDYGGVVVI
ncbi:hypothetical protein LXL04_028147 [Taraxacum kok-saghyz]